MVNDLLQVDKISTRSSSDLYDDLNGAYDGSPVQSRNGSRKVQRASVANQPRGSWQPRLPYQCGGVRSKKKTLKKSPRNQHWMAE